MVALHDERRHLGKFRMLSELGPVAVSVLLHRYSGAQVLIYDRFTDVRVTVRVNQSTDLHNLKLHTGVLVEWQIQLLQGLLELGFVSKDLHNWNLVHVDGVEIREILRGVLSLDHGGVGFQQRLELLRNIWAAGPYR